VNEKAALEVAAGASYSGARTMVTMKQVGLNVAADPLMSLVYVGIKGGMVIVVADDPGPISSQTEQDTRHFSHFAKLPVFDPSSPEEAYEMIIDAFDYSEKYQTPVLFRPTTRVCHGCASIEIREQGKKHQAEGFVKDSKWVIFPRLSYQNHLALEKTLPIVGQDFSQYRFNTITGSGRKGIASGGISSAYAKEALKLLQVPSDKQICYLHVATPYPFPEDMALHFLDQVDEVLVAEELDPVIERELIYLCGKYHKNVTIQGKLSGHMPKAGENSVEILKRVLSQYLEIPMNDHEAEADTPPLPVRPPVLCAGCPHRASFYAVKQGVKGRKAVFSGDIGCYTLGNAMPLDMVDTCLCMGADVTMAQGLHRMAPDTLNFSFIGDSTFFASGLTGVVNAVYNETDIIIVVLDNSTTAMTGHQPHPGTGRTMMGNTHEPVSIAKILEAIGVSSVETVDPLHLEAATEAVQRAADAKGVRAIIFKSPCIAVAKPKTKFVVTEDCTQCKKCIKSLGCPAIALQGKEVTIEPSLCFGCGLCRQICPSEAIWRADTMEKGSDKHDK
ncbi:MAG: indolepyruvate ferredoxin oxidoreductase subunit alpha, partial [Bacillota bacterium]|nr:indolepyruvate ferredoxin oxidoreductase subunit alpha [Bacillota bacterium]